MTTCPACARGDRSSHGEHSIPAQPSGTADRAVIARRKGNEARHIAAIVGTTEWVHDKPDPNDGRLPESAFDWPIYRAATTADVYGALWGQASPAEERVLDTLAHCAGLRTSLRPDPGCDVCGLESHGGHDAD